MILRYLLKRKKKTKQQTRNPYINYWNLKSRYKNEIWEWKIVHACKEKRLTPEVIEHPNQESISTFGEKNYNYLEMSETDSIKQTVMKENVREG